MIWAVDDSEMNKITSMFYDNIKDKCGHLDYTCVAFVLNEITGNLVHILFKQHVSYIHLGV